MSLIRSPADFVCDELDFGSTKGGFRKVNLPATYEAALQNMVPSYERAFAILKVLCGTIESERSIVFLHRW